MPKIVEYFGGKKKFYLFIKFIKLDPSDRIHMQLICRHPNEWYLDPRNLYYRSPNNNSVINLVMLIATELNRWTNCSSHLFIMDAKHWKITRIMVYIIFPYIISIVFIGFIYYRYQCATRHYFRNTNNHKFFFASTFKELKFFLMYFAA